MYCTRHSLGLEVVSTFYMNQYESKDDSDKAITGYIMMQQIMPKSHR